jgi:hypothetical protein
MGTSSAGDLARLISGWRPPKPKPAAPKTKPAPTSKPPTLPAKPEEPITFATAGTEKGGEAIPSREASFETHEHVESWVKSTFPNARDIDIRGIPIESWRVIAEHVTLITERFPGLSSRVYHFGGEDLDGAFASVSGPFGSSLKFDKTWWFDLERLTEQIKEGSMSGFYTPGAGRVGPGYVVTDEMGHMTEAFLEDKPPEIHRELMSLFSKPLEPGRRYADIDMDKASTISRYAATNENEAFAETLAAAKHQKNPMNTIVKRFKEILFP